jgi:Protein of unknown function (DUF3592)
MTQESLPPLDPPPRKAHVRRATRNLRRAYATLFALVILVFGGWAVLGAFRWSELESNERFLRIAFGLAALLAVIILRFVDHPLRRELRLARRGLVAQGQIASIGKTRGRRATPTITYTFRTAAGATIEGRCALPRRIPVAALAPGMALDVLYDPKNPQVNKPRLALEHVEFGAAGKKKSV